MTLNEYKAFREYQKSKLNEEVNLEINSDKNLLLSRYNDDLKFYNTNKSKLDSITSLDSEDWEEKANEIIKNNKYLGLYWKLTKSIKKASTIEEKIRNSELTAEEKTNLETELNTIKNDTRDLQSNLDNTIKKDLDNIKKL